MHGYSIFYLIFNINFINHDVINCIMCQIISYKYKYFVYMEEYRMQANLIKDDYFS